MSNALHKPAARKPLGYVTIIGVIMGLLLSVPSLFATTKGLSQIVTPDLQAAGDLSLSLQIQDKRIANPYQLQGELGVTNWAEVAVFCGLSPDEWIFRHETCILSKVHYILYIGVI